LQRDQRSQRGGRPRAEEREADLVRQLGIEFFRTRHHDLDTPTPISAVFTTSVCPIIPGILYPSFEEFRRVILQNAADIAPATPVVRRPKYRTAHE
jgi:hypothetical protein